jgi:hypothetical protein
MAKLRNKFFSRRSTIEDGCVFHISKQKYEKAILYLLTVIKLFQYGIRNKKKTKYMLSRDIIYVTPV